MEPFSPDEYGRRLEAARTRTADHDLDALLIGPSADLAYLIGYDAPALTRLTACVISGERAVLLVPSLEEARARSAPLPDGIEITPHAETEDAIGRLADILPSTGGVGVGDRFWARFLIPLINRSPHIRWDTAEPLVSSLRQVKSPAEIARLRAAGGAIDSVHAQVPELLAIGRTEREVGEDIAELITSAGHEEVNFVIVASGSNGASPHHELSDRVLEPGDAVVIDIGGKVDGYCSDCTRNYVLGAPPTGYEDAYEVLRSAQQAALDAVRPGVSAAEVDEVARDVIDGGGYSDLVLHRTGHGIGLDEHEEPYIVAGNPTPLEVGMTFSVEPGLYRPREYGMRIEDIVVVSETGAERLNTLDRGLIVM